MVLKDWIYTRLPLPEAINNVSLSRIWIPAYVKVSFGMFLTVRSLLPCESKQTWENTNRIRVSVRAGPKLGQEFDVTEALPFTLETANACKLAGYYVMETDGRLTKPPGRSIFVPTETVKPPPTFSGFRVP